MDLCFHRSILSLFLHVEIFANYVTQIANVFVTYILITWQSL